MFPCLISITYEYFRNSLCQFCACDTETFAELYRAEQNGLPVGTEPAVNSPVVIDVCVPNSEVIDGSIVGRAVQSCCYCVSES